MYQNILKFRRRQNLRKWILGSYMVKTEGMCNFAEKYHYLIMWLCCQCLAALLSWVAFVFPRMFAISRIGAQDFARRLGNPLPSPTCGTWWSLRKVVESWETGIGIVVLVGQYMLGEMIKKIGQSLLIMQ